MRAILTTRTLLLLVVIAMLAVACAADEPDAAGEESEVDVELTEAATLSGMGAESEIERDTNQLGTTDDGGIQGDEALDDTATPGVVVGDVPEDESFDACDADAIMAMVESGPEEGTTAGMAEVPVATAASSNPVLTQLSTAIEAAGLVDSLNEADAVTVFAPSDCAFSNLDPATLDAAMADPSGMLTQILGYHVIPGERLAADELSGEYESFVGEQISVVGTTVAGQAEIIVPDVETANGTVHIIDAVLMPRSIAEAQGEAGGSEPPVADDDAGEDVDGGEADSGEGEPQDASGAATEDG